MEKLSQDYILRLSFSNSIAREELLQRKYEDYLTYIKDKDMRETIKEFMETSNEHIKLLKDKRLKLNYEK